MKLLYFRHISLGSKVVTIGYYFYPYGVFARWLVMVKYGATFNRIPVMITDADVDYNSGMAAFEAKEFANAMRFLRPFAEQGVGEAQHRIAIMMQNGLGMVRNEIQAYKWMKMAAEQGHALAQHGLGFMYMEGDCISKDSQKAVHWFTQAANQGLAGSQTTLAMMYENGEGVEKDLDIAKKWFQKAGF